MRIIFTISFFVVAYSFVNRPLVTGAVYHVKNGGSDAADGLTDATAWATTDKVNAMQSSFNAGDSILFKRGSVFNDSLIITKSGGTVAPIIYGAYGTGANPEITGFQSLTVTNSGNIWSGTATNSIKSQNTVLINDTIRFKARYPNGKSILSFYTLPTKYSMTITHQATDYTGKHIVVRSAPWEWDNTTVLNQHNGGTYDTLNFNYPITFTSGNAANAWFLQNNIGDLDSLNEYVYDSTSKLISVYATSIPTVKYSTIDTLVELRGSSNITFTNITFSGANQAAFNNYYFRNLIIKNCNIRNCGAYGVLIFAHNGAKVINDSITDILSNGSYSGTDSSLVFNDNYVKNIAIYAGMGRSSASGYTGGYMGFKNIGDSFSVQRNQFINIGYIPVIFRGRFGMVKNNFIDSFCFVKNDGGAIYTNLSASDPTNKDSGTVVRKNIMRRGGAPLPGDLGTIVIGIYLDDLANYLNIDSNTIDNVYFGISSKGWGHRITNNTVQKVLYYPVNNSTNNPGNVITGNVSWSNTTGLKLSYTTDTTETIDNNRYLPTDTTSVVTVASTRYSFGAYKALYPKYDVHSTSSFPSYISSTTPTLFYNPNSTDSTIALTGYWADANNKQYGGAMKVEAGGSRLLFPSILIPGFKTGNKKFR